MKRTTDREQFKRSNAATARPLILVRPAEFLILLTEHKRATRNGDINNRIAEHHLQTKPQN